MPGCRGVILPLHDSSEGHGHSEQRHCPDLGCEEPVPYYSKLRGRRHLSKSTDTSSHGAHSVVRRPSEFWNTADFKQMLDTGAT